MENSNNWIDISVPLYTGMAHWPDNPPVRIERMVDLALRHAVNVSKIELGAHTGTHMDALRHFLVDGARLNELPRDREIWVICRSAQRAYNATRILLQNGFTARILSGGMLSRTNLQ